MRFEENIFQLPDPEFYDCFIERYQSSFHVLRIRAERHHDAPPQPLKVAEFVFTDVLYLAGNFNWTGASICRADVSTTFQVMAETQLLTPQDPDEEIEDTLGSYALFHIPTTEGLSVRFIAHRYDYTMTVIG